MPASADPLPAYLRRVARAVRVQAVVRQAACVGAGLVAAFLLALGLDAWLALPLVIRWLFALLLVLGVVAGAASIWRVARQYRYADRSRSLARLVEVRLGLRDSSLINAVDLSEQGYEAGARALVDEALRQSRSRAAELTVMPVLRWRSFARDAAAAAVALLCLLLLASTQPRLMSMTATRLLMPWLDGPPYAAVDVQVTWTPAPAVVGRPAVVRAQARVMVAGVDLPQRADVVWLDGREAGGETPMWWRGQGVFELALTDLRGAGAEGALRFYVKTPVGRSRVMTLSLVDQPQVDRVVSRTTLPEYAGEGVRVMETLGQSVHRIRALAGSSAQVTLDAQLALGAVLVKADGKAWEGATFARDPDDATAMRATWPIAQSGTYTLTPVSAAGTPGQAVVLDVLAFDDEPPVVDIRQPTPELIGVAEGEVVELTVAASDDVGLREVMLSAGLSSELTQAMELWREAADANADALAPRQRRLELRATLAPALLGAKAGDMVFFQASVQDTNNVTARSALKAVAVLSPEEHAALAEAREAVERMLDAIGDWPTQNDRAMDAAQSLATELRRQADAMEREAGEGEAALPDADELAKQAEALQREARDLAQAMRDRAAGEGENEAAALREAFEQWREAMARALDESQQAAADVEALADDAPAEAQGEPRASARATAAQLRALADRLQPGLSSASRAAAQAAAGQLADAVRTGQSSQPRAADSFAQQFRNQLAQQLREAMQSAQRSAQSGPASGRGQGQAAAAPSVDLASAADAAAQAAGPGGESGSAGRAESGDAGPPPAEALVVHGQVERFRSSAQGDRQAIPGHGRVVPAEFRDATEAYFRRLAQPRE